MTVHTDTEGGVLVPGERTLWWCGVSTVDSALDISITRQDDCAKTFASGYFTSPASSATNTVLEKVSTPTVSSGRTVALRWCHVLSVTHSHCDTSVTGVLCVTIP